MCPRSLALHFAFPSNMFEDVAEIQPVRGYALRYDVPKASSPGCQLIGRLYAMILAFARL